MAVGDGKLFVFGGYVRGARQNDLHSYDFESGQWEQLFASDEESKEAPLPRTGHSLVHNGNALYVFGGQNDFNDKMNDLWKYDLGSKV